MNKYNFESREHFGETIIKIFQENETDFGKLIYTNNTPMPEGSSFYDGTIEEVWDDLLRKVK